MIQALFNKHNRKKISWLLLTVLTLELFLPNVSMALSSGPVQPEVQGFEPVGTTDMVDNFTGDFVYNIPLIDIEGYPVNIAYHGGVTMEQEASWVGLGWNITPGAVNHAIRGLPDEFAGDTVEKELNIKDEITKKIGLNVGVEPLGIGDPYLQMGANLGGYLTISNYRGVGVDFTASGGVNMKVGPITAGMNVGASVGSQSGGSINYGASIGLGASKTVSQDLNAGGSFNLNTGGVYSPRTGMRQDWGLSASASMKSSGSTSFSTGFGTGFTVPIGVQNYTAAVTNASYMNAYSGQLKLGGEIYGIYINGKINGAVSRLEFEKNGSRKGYGYFHLDDAKPADLTDFSREKDGMFNTTMQYLPQSHLTYDVYSVSGQGTGGSFRPFRNDIGSVYDPITSSEQNTESVNIEAGLGNLLEIGGEYIKAETNTESGPWSDYHRPFTGKATSGTYEDIYFKEAGELTENNTDYLNSKGGNTELITLEESKSVPLTKPSADKRVIRSNHIYMITGKAEDTAAILDTKKLESYTDTNGFAGYPTVNKTNILRVDTSTTKKLKRKANHVTEIVQVQKDGRRYIYGLPVMNHVQREATFAVDTTKSSNQVNKAAYLVKYAKGMDDSYSNSNGVDHFYTSTVTPSYVAAHLLTGVLSKDYVDVTGNGISDDDLGTYTKFNYSRKSSDYRWRTPIDTGKAQYIPGYMTDRKDDKASYMVGSREQWLLHSIETKNYVAEFYVSKRTDAKGVMDRILYGSNTTTYDEAPYNTTPEADQNVSYKLDSIVLYNKHDRFINGASAQPIKTAMFTYDYSLCSGTPNAASGKLTLKKIQIRFGHSNINMSAAYNFSYTNNYAYNAANKDRWGFYKEPESNVNNYEFPFVKQDTVTNNYAKAWSLSEIKLPSGGVIKVDYEADDYAYVQDKLAMEMFRITGIGNSATYDGGANQLYFNPNQPNLYLFFTRRKDMENSNLTMKENYLKESNLLYFNVPVELKEGFYEPIKGYAEVDAVGKCSDSVHGYIRLFSRQLKGSGALINPITFSALNTGRYSLPHILYPGSNPDETDIDNIVAGLKSSIKELFSVHKNPLEMMMKSGKGKDAELTNAFMRLNSPGLMKKGGGQRVKTVKFYDSWDAMVGGMEAVYGKQYDYTMEREDGKGIISSGVASYEPMIGGDENPLRLPAGFQGQGTNNFPPNDPVELYQEMPLGESFFPAPVVGYRKVTIRSINLDKGRSSQSEDIAGFYTAKDFPIIVKAGELFDGSYTEIGLNTTITQNAEQGFVIRLNDMHGKPRNTEHWVLKTAGGPNAKELVNYQKYEYRMENGQLSNQVPSFVYDAAAGQMSVANKQMGIETDLTIDSRIREEKTRNKQLSVNVNGFIVLAAPIFIPLPYFFSFENDIRFRCATATKVIQQYGIIDKVISNNEGAITEMHNEVFDAQTGNALVTSVNNEFGDRTYNVSYPAHWAYKEMGPSFENHDVSGTLDDTLKIDSFGVYAQRFVNYNPAFSQHYDLPRNMPVGRIRVDEGMIKYRIGDEMMVKYDSAAVPERMWVMGYTSDTDHCYLVIAPREPYKQNSYWSVGANYPDVKYRVLRSGYKNQLGESIQSYTTTDSSNIFPYLKNDLSHLIALNAVRYNPRLSQVYAANTVSDSLNPFVTGKVGNYRPEMQVLNLKSRSYAGGYTRTSGTFTSPAYWKVEQDKHYAYCSDSFHTELQPPAGPPPPPYVPPSCDSILTELTLTYLGGDDVQISYTTTTPGNNVFNFKGFNHLNWAGNNVQSKPGFNPYQYANGSLTGTFTIENYFLCTGMPVEMTVQTGNGCTAKFILSTKQYYMREDPTKQFKIQRDNYKYISGGAPAVYLSGYSYNISSPDITTINPPNIFIPPALPTNLGPVFITPYRVGKKIQLGKVGHYDFTDPGVDWITTQRITKYNWLGEELENYDPGIGYNSAVFGYNQQLPMCVAKNARHGQVLFDGFEDYALLQPVPDKFGSYMPLYYAPFQQYTTGTNTLGSFYKTGTLTSSSPAFSISKEKAHTGNYCIKVNSGNIALPLNGTGTGMADGYSFKMEGNHKYVASVWLRPVTDPGNVVLQGYSPSVAISLDTMANGTLTAAELVKSMEAKSNIIDGWQQYEVTFDAPAEYKYFKLRLGSGYYYDDLRIFPFESNSKGFVYHPVTRKLMATLDENNYATFFEYDAEGNLVRTKKETEKGILTVSESRNTHRKAN